MINELAQISTLQIKDEKPLNVVVTSVSKRMQRHLSKNQAYKWAMNFKEQGVEKLVDSADIIYLTPDSPKVLRKFNFKWGYQKDLRHRGTRGQEPAEGGKPEEGTGPWDQHRQVPS